MRAVPVHVRTERWGDVSLAVFIGAAPIGTRGGDGVIPQLVDIVYPRPVSWTLTYIVEFVAGWQLENTPITTTFRATIGVGQASMQLDTALVQIFPYLRLSSTSTVPAAYLSVDARITGAPAQAGLHSMRVGIFATPRGFDP